MRPNRIYLLHPPPSRLPGIVEELDEVRRLIETDDDWRDWDLVSIPYSESNSFHVGELYGRVCSRNGPVVLLEKVQRKPLDELRQKCQRKTPIVVAEAYDAVTIYGSIADARKRFENWEPVMPLRLVLAVLIVRKLNKSNFWGGNDKSYLWGDDLPKGGMPSGVSPAQIYEVANALLLKNVLQVKPSGRQKKYALNPGCRDVINQLIADGTVVDESLRRVLTKGNRELPASLLDSEGWLK